jgi:uncharacterized protein
MTAPASLARIELVTVDGCVLAADRYAPADPASVRGAAVVAHPHPLYGGDRHNPVVDAIFRRLPDVGIATVRFDFRGVGASTGVHGDGITERLDVESALDHLRAEYPDVPLFVVGYSFGSIVGLRVTESAGVAAWVAVAPPLGRMPPDAGVAESERPKLLVVAGHDQFTSEADVRALTEEWRATTIEVLPSADHFLAGHTARVAQLTADFLAPFTI